MNYRARKIYVCTLRRREPNREHSAFSDPKFILEHPRRGLIESLRLILSSPPECPTCHEYVVKAEIPRISGYPHPVIFRTSGPSRNTRPPPSPPPPPPPPGIVGVRAPSRPTVDPWRSSILLFSSYRPLSLPPSFSSSFRGRRWKRWLRGTEKLIISDTNLSGLLGGW